MQLPIVAFTTVYDGLSRVLVNDVYISSPVKKGSSQQVTRPSNSRQYKALWDTGATGSVITRRVVDECGLKPIGLTRVHHAQGTGTYNVYLVGVFLPNAVCIPSLRVTEGQLAGNVDVLIGMDIMSQGDFAVSNRDGRTVFTFRMPSTERTDFVQQIRGIPKRTPVSSAHKAGRNAPCPCGSGKKYKRCCGR